jgi:prepilin-type N-terminal cleavage/methylation domain-containing protein
MLFRSKRRSGFTLAETLVTVAIIAVLAAVIVPAVTQQIGKGDDANVTSTIKGVQSGVTSYVSDVRRYPALLSQLINDVSTGEDSTLAPSGTLNASQKAQWKGPYMQTTLTLADSLPLGLGLFGKDTMRVTANYLILRINGTTNEKIFLHVDSLIDSGNGKAAGLLQWTSAAGVLDSIATFKLLVAR